MEQSSFQADLRTILNSDAPFLNIPKELIIQFCERHNPSDPVKPNQDLTVSHIMLGVVNPLIWDLLLKDLEPYVTKTPPKNRKEVLERFVEDVVTDVRTYMEDFHKIFPQDVEAPY